MAALRLGASEAANIDRDGGNGMGRGQDDGQNIAHALAASQQDRRAAIVSTSCNAPHASCVLLILPQHRGDADLQLSSANQS